MTSTRLAYIKRSEVLAAADVYRGPRWESVPPSLIVGKCGREDRRRLARLGFDRFSPDTTLASDCWIFQTIYEIIIKTETHKKYFVWEPQTFLRIFHWACKKCWKLGSWCFLRTLNTKEKTKTTTSSKCCFIKIAVRCSHRLWIFSKSHGNLSNGCEVVSLRIITSRKDSSSGDHEFISSSRYFILDKNTGWLIIPRRKEEEEEDGMLLRQETAQTKESRNQQPDKKREKKPTLLECRSKLSAGWGSPEKVESC